MLRGKSYLVTGSTDGIGRQTVIKLAASGADVLLHGRYSYAAVYKCAAAYKQATVASVSLTCAHLQEP